MTDDQLAEAALFRRLGLSWRKIESLFGVPFATIRDAIDRQTKSASLQAVDELK